MIDRLVVSDPLLVAVIVAISGFIIVLGRVDLALGVYCAILSWAYIVDIGEMSLLWLAVGTIGLAASVRVFRDLLNGKSFLAYVVGNQGLILWVILWMFWMLLNFFLFQTSYADRLIRNTLLFNGLSFGMTLLFMTELENVKRMSYAFVLTSILAGMISYWLLPVPIEILVQNPEFRFRGFTEINYLTFAIPFALSAIFSFTSFWSVKRLFARLFSMALLIAAIIFLALTGARQSIIGVSVALIFFLLWTIKQDHLSRRSGVVVIGIVALIFFSLYTNTELAERWATVPRDYDVRVEFWTDAYDLFVQSPIWGNGLDYAGEFATAHNLFLDTLAGQGFVGTGFLLGFLAIAFYASRDVWSSKGNSELAIWRMGMLSAVLYVLVHTFFSGSIPGAPHLFWIVALIWRLYSFTRSSSSPLSVESSERLLGKPISRGGSV